MFHTFISIIMNESLYNSFKYNKITCLESDLWNCGKKIKFQMYHSTYLRSKNGISSTRTILIVIVT